MHRPVSGPFDDPCLFVRLQREKRAILFDSGMVYPLSPGDIHKISDIFVTHTHIDHFIGFDHIMRMLLGRDAVLNVYGPPQIVECVQGKLNGYAWNLIKDYPMKIEVFGISEKGIRHVSFHASDRFAPKEREGLEYKGIALKNACFSVNTAVLEHDIECIAYSMEEDFHINIDKSAVEGLGLEVGSWLTDFKRALRASEHDETVIHVQERDFTLGFLADRIAMITPGQKIAYVMDASPAEKNIERAISIADGAHTLYMEAYFLHDDLDRARERNHMTARLSGLIARNAHVSRLVLTHCSPKYRENREVLLREAESAFDGPVQFARPLSPLPFQT